MFERTKIDLSLEKRILAGMVVSKKFMNRIYPIVNMAYFESTHIAKIAGWTSEFYGSYQDVPGQHIKDIIVAHKKKLLEEDILIMGKIVDDLLSLYSIGDFNDEYLTDQAVEFFKKRELEITANNIKYFLGKDEVNKAEREIDDFRKVSRPMLEENSFIYSEEALNNTFMAMKDKDDYFFRMPKDFGRFMGDLNRGWLVSIAAPFKCGKSFMLGDMAAIAALSGLRVVFFSLEMSINEMRSRIYKRMTGASEEYGSVMFPCFDCKKNKDNSCQKDERVNQMKCPGTFSPASKYRPCSICKDTFEDKDDFELGFWNEIIDVPNFDYPTVQHKIGLLKKEGKANIWLKSKPRFSASIEDLENDLDNLEYVHGFIPDVIVIDYADILQADNKDVSGVQKEDEVWMCLARMASKKKALVLTATQLNKDSLTAKQITTAHTAKWIGKLGHVDAMFALNQTPEEKAMGLVRVSILEHRHKHFIQTQNCYVLQKFSVGCFHLDSYF
ncbi:MAG: hypothetical protein WC516_09425 [Patescibacteria group bacterium]